MSKFARIPHDVIAKLIRAELESFGAVHGTEKYCTLKHLEEVLRIARDTIEEICREADGVAVVPADVIRKEQPDFPRSPRGDKTKGFLPGIKLETESERRARQTRERMVLRAVEAVNAAVTGLGVQARISGTSIELYVDEDQEGAPADALSAVLLSLEAAS
jgi:hypothetical protein